MGIIYNIIYKYIYIVYTCPWLSYNDVFLFKSLQRVVYSLNVHELSSHRENLYGAIRPHWNDGESME